MDVKSAKSSPPKNFTFWTPDSRIRNFSPRSAAWTRLYPSPAPSLPYPFARPPLSFFLSPSPSPPLSSTAAALISLVAAPLGLSPTSSIASLHLLPHTSFTAAGRALSARRSGFQASRCDCDENYVPPEALASQPQTQASSSRDESALMNAFRDSIALALMNRT